VTDVIGPTRYTGVMMSIELETLLRNTLCWVLQPRIAPVKSS
jgi:hypothetical protein